jgi:hypothetical protein
MARFTTREMDELTVPFVLQQIERRRSDWDAHRMPYNHPGYDIEASRRRDGRLLRISVKGVQGADFQVANDFDSHTADIQALVDVRADPDDFNTWNTFLIGHRSAAQLALDRRCVWLLAHGDSSGRRKAKLRPSFLRALGTEEAWELFDELDPANWPDPDPWRQYAREEAPIERSSGYANSWAKVTTEGLWPPASCPNLGRTVNVRGHRSCCGAIEGRE